MSFWTGTHWEQADPAPKTRPSRIRHSVEAVAEGTLVAALLVGLIAGTTLAGKGNGRGANSSTASIVLTANPDTVRAGDLFDVRGCGFDSSLGSVIVGFTGGSWGSSLSGGCFTITGIPALSGDTLDAGTYDVTAYQYVNGRWRAQATTTVRVVAD